MFTLSDDDSETNKTPKSITVYCNYENQPNTCYFDDICLIKEPVPTYSYDEDGNLVSATENAQKSSSMSYDVNDNLTGVTDEKNVNYTYTYSSASNPHQLTSATDNETGIRSDYVYFDNGTIKAINVVPSDNSGLIRTSVAYTTSEDSIADGAYVYRYVDQHGRNTYYDYDQQSGLLNSVKDPNGVYTYYTYNEDNGLVTSVSSAGSTVNYTYDSTNTKLNSVNHNGFNYNFTYDGFGNTLQTKVGNTALITNEYAVGNGNLTKSTYGNGDVRSFTYDETGRLLNVKNNNATAYSWTYSGSGVPNSYTDNVSGKKYQYTYDSLGRLIYQSGKNISDNNNQSSSVYKYDISNNLTQITNTAGTLGVSAWYHYDAINRPTKSYFNTSVEHNYTYDTLGGLSNTALVFSSKTINKNYSYYPAAIRNSSGSTSYQTTQLKTETIGDRGYTYTYDKVGNITAITEKTTASGSYNEKVSYTYDSLGQLTRENNKDLNKTLVYSYDNGGNITSVKEYAYTTGTVEGTATDTVTYTYDSTWKDKLVSYDGQSITYDSIGNPLTYRDGMTFTWFGRQMETANVGNTAISYEYNSDGLRTEKKVGNTVHTYEYTGNTLYYENRGGIQLHYRYDVNGNLASITRIDTAGTKFTLYVICNSRGDVEELRKLNGTLYARYIYDTWGNTIHIYDANGAEITSTANLAVQNPIRYRGYYFDSETGFYYLQSRYYDPVTCRFLNIDGYVSTGQGILGYNMFSYCNNNPVRLSDSGGSRPIDSLSVNNETSYEKDQSFSYMMNLPYYNQIAQTQSYLQKMGFADTSYNTAKDCTDSMIKNGIDTVEEKAHYFSQCAYESWMGQYLTEYGTEEYLASKTYYPYYGAGYIQLTHKYNYELFAAYMGDPQILIQGPSYVAENYAWSAAGWFWSYRGINNAIENGANVKTVTRMVQGGSGGLATRQIYYDTFFAILGG